MTIQDYDDYEGIKKNIPVTFKSTDRINPRILDELTTLFLEVGDVLVYSRSLPRVATAG